MIYFFPIYQEKVSRSQFLYSVLAHPAFLAPECGNVWYKGNKAFSVHFFKTFGIQLYGLESTECCEYLRSPQVAIRARAGTALYQPSPINGAHTVCFCCFSSRAVSNKERSQQFLLQLSRAGLLLGTFIRDKSLVLWQCFP